jgi:FtsP/CotA-like multicopper oxidase with cupredoxin domain
MKKIVAIVLFFCCVVKLSAQVKTTRLHAKMNLDMYLSTGDTTKFWGYGRYYLPSGAAHPSLPGPLLLFYTGDSVHVPFYNLSSEDHTIHWHGLDVDQMNDGVPHTSFAIHFGDSVVYKFKTPHSGLFLYHCHVQTVLHLPMGLYGGVLVKNSADTMKLYAGGPGFNKEYIYIFSDLDKSFNDDPMSPGPFQFYNPDYFMVNGLSDWQQFSDPSQVINASAGDSIAAHFGNIGYTTIHLTFPSELNARIYMSDGRPLPASFGADSIRIYPGERYEVIFKPVVNFNGYITATYHNAILDSEMGLNYIGVNNYGVPGSVNEQQANSGIVHVFPNPATQFITVVSEKSQHGYLTDVSGNIIKRMSLVKGSNSFDISSLESGVYIMYTPAFAEKVVISK